MICRNVKVNGRRTSLRMDAETWNALWDVSRRRGMTADALLSEIDRARGDVLLTPALRLYLLGYYKTLVQGLEGYGMTRAAMDELTQGGVSQTIQ